MVETLTRSMFALLVLVFLGAGCAIQPESKGHLQPGSEDEALTSAEANIGVQYVCTASCGSCTTLSCDYQSSCLRQDGSNGYVECDGVRQSCQTCTFNGQTYTDGQFVTGARCSSKLNGYCIGGIFAGKSCVASGDCYAECCNGTWQ